MSDQFDLYNKKVMQHFTNPKNMGSIKNPDGVGLVGNPKCGDVMKIFIKVKSKDEKGKNIEYIDDIKVQTLGCGAAIATSSMASEMVKGKSLDEALKLSNAQVAKALGGLPPVKMHCSVLAEQGIAKAIEDYRKKKNAQK
jgi:nitrogen fixation NifU-like protein